ncbi:hypothetical protein PR002_g32787 [Phytophthora rubi]|uniref:Uncharacterized protein n=1 Tax=Phytophthora rubi TaxID=129364 RepID=A0A6A3G505_9STRA|nr:hypothetical protein PR002_g32787 [Phytophthora rubi]
MSSNTTKAACRAGFITRRACIAISCGVFAPPSATCTSRITTSAVVARGAAARHVMRAQIFARTP